ncbi:cytochrome P450 2U1 [Strongylocentrotus purpuratus]|uniref:Steroid 21-hydroxylase n=1 Tax=Strongylocentrotus purpuratus TaxID=7668 RepID=A0A7M7T376_STRPU|nr:cytochrome P450 2U1 [Strongylocentrotus purpuratus]
MSLLTDYYGVALAVLSLVLTLIWYLKNSSSWRYRNLPPGPLGLPILGILPYLDEKNPSVDVLRMSKRYGPIFGGFLGSHRAVFLNDYDTIKETFARTDDVFSDRPRIAIFELYSDGQGVACCYLENHWKEQRRFTLRALRNYGMGRLQGSLRNAIDVEVSHLMTAMSKIKKPFDPRIYVESAVCNITCKMVFGRRYEYEDAQFTEFLHNLEKIFELSGVAGVVNYLSWMKYVPFSGYHALGDCVRHLENGLFTKECEEHQKVFDPNRSPRDLIEAFLLELHKKQQEKVENNGEDMRPTGFNHQQMLHFIADVFAAGTDTTASTLKWSLIHLMKFEDEQRKIQEELDHVIGRDRMPSLEDKPNLPYTQAFLAESLRYGCAGPLGVPHGAKDDTKLRGYDIPKGTVIVANLYAVLYDPKVFPEPDKFNPSRFIDEEGRVKTSLIERAHSQFGIGRRQCVGMDMALMERFVFITNLIHRFNARAPNGPDSVTIDARGGLAFVPMPFEMQLTER